MFQRLKIPVSFRKSPLRWLLLAVIRMYQSTSSVRPPICRYHPTCSEYMAQSLITHGVFRGLALGIRRIIRCNPYSPGGFDPVPERKEISPF